MYILRDLLKGKEMNYYKITQENAVLSSKVSAVEISVETYDDDFGDEFVFDEQGFVGTAFVSRPDSYDKQLGYDLAFWRAVQNAANRNLKRLDGLVKHNDDIRELQAEQKERRKAKQEADKKAAAAKAKKAAKAAKKK